MGRFWEPWTAAEGEKISGIILYFENRDGSYTAIIRTPDRFFVLPAEVAEAFVAGRPSEGSEIELEKTSSGYQLRMIPKTIVKGV